MANELRHADVGTALSKTEWEATAGHIFNNQAAGDTMYASSTSQLSRLAIGSANQVLAVNSGATAPEWVSAVALATSFTASANNSTDETVYPVFVDGATGTQGAETDTGLTYNPSSGIITSTGYAGTLQTAAQGNVTSLGTLTTLTVDNVIINGTTIGHTGDTDLMTLASTVLTVAGEVDATTLDISSSADIAGDLVLSGGADGALQFTNAGENSIKIPDNQASALIIEEADNAYMTFVTSNGSEAITVAKATTFSAGIANAGTIAAGTWNGTAIGSSYIAGDAITGAKIADDAIDSEHYTDGSIDTAHLADDAVSLAKMASGTDGQIITYDASGNPTAVGPGTDGQVLTSTGSGSPPAFESVAAGIITVRAGETLAAGAPVALENNSGTIEAVNIHGWGNDASDPTSDNKIYTLQGEMGSGKLVPCGSAGLAWVYTAQNSDTQSGNYAYATIGTYSTTTKQIEWSTPVAVTSAVASPVTASWDSNVDRLLIVYSIQSANTKGVVYAISGGALVTAGATAPGTAVDVTGGTTYNEVPTRMEFDSDNNMHHYLYEDGGDSDYLKLAGLTVTGGTTNTVAVTIAGTKVNGANITTSYGIALKWGNDKALIVYEDGGDSNYCKAIIATHNGSAYSWGSIIEPFGANQAIDIPYYVTGNAIAFDTSNNNWVIGGYWTDGDSDVVLRLVATTNDLSTLGTPVTYDTVPSYLVSENISPAAGDSIATFSAFAGVTGIGVDYDPDRNCVVIVSRVNVGDANQGFIDPEYEMMGQQPGHTSAGGQQKHVVAYVTLGGTNDVVLTKGDMKLHHNINRRLSMPSQWGTSYVTNMGFLTAYDTHHNKLFFVAANAYLGIYQYSLYNAYSYMAENFTYVFEGPATSGDYSAYGSSNMGQFVGFNTSAVTADGSATATITVKGGVNENQSSLTVGEEYWIGDSGGLVVAPPKWSMHMYKAGIAIAADKLYVQNDYSSYLN